MPTGCLWGPETHLPVGQMQLGTEAVWQMPGANPERGSPAPGPPPGEGEAVLDRSHRGNLATGSSSCSLLSTLEFPLRWNVKPSPGQHAGHSGLAAEAGAAARGLRVPRYPSDQTGHPHPLSPRSTAKSGQSVWSVPRMLGAQAGAQGIWGSSREGAHCRPVCLDHPTGCSESPGSTTRSLQTKQLTIGFRNILY